MPNHYISFDHKGHQHAADDDGGREAKLQRDRKAFARRKARKDQRHHPFRIDPVPEEKDKAETKPVLGGEIIPDLYPGTVALLAKTRSGKTTVISHITNHCIDERTAVYIFCKTVNLDPTWKTIVRDLRRRGVSVTTYTSLMTDKMGGNALSRLFDTFEAEIQTERKEKAPKSLHELAAVDKNFLALPNPIADPDSVKPLAAKDESAYETSAPRRWVIVDDMGRQHLRHNIIEDCLKKTRHYKCRMLISTQHIIHIAPSALTQYSAVCMWRGFSPVYMAKLHDRLSMFNVIDFKSFWVLYSSVTKEKHAFLTYHLTDETFRNGFALPPLDTQAVFGDPSLKALKTSL